MPDMENEFQTEGGAQKHGVRGAVIAIVALAAVLAIGTVAYNALGGAGAPTQYDSAQEAATGDAQYLADFDATVFDEYGDARTLTALADGKPFVMNFWATWCPYCVQEMDDYQAIVDDYDGRVSFAFIDIADGTRETVDDATAWLYKNEYHLPAYYDTRLEAMRAYGATSLPTTVVVAADGEIMTISAGRIDPQLMREALDSLLEG